MYEKFVADYYDDLPMITTRRDLEFYRELARLQDDPVLDLGCGTGRVLLPLAQAGCRIVGLDRSEEMLARCRQKLEQQPHDVRQRVRLVHGDMTRFDLGETFRLVLIPFRPFQHLLSVDQQITCLRDVHRHLAADGKLVFDLFQTDPRRMYDPGFTQESAPYTEVNLPDGRKLNLTERIRAFHRAEQANDVEMMFYITHSDGRTERLVHAFTVRYFFRYEVEHLLARCGFRVAELFGDFDRSPLRDDSPDMIFIAEKS